MEQQLEPFRHHHAAAVCDFFWQAVCTPHPRARHEAAGRSSVLVSALAFWVLPLSFGMDETQEM